MSYQDENPDSSATVLGENFTGSQILTLWTIGLYHLPVWGDCGYRVRR